MCEKTFEVKRPYNELIVVVVVVVLASFCILSLVIEVSSVQKSQQRLSMLIDVLCSCKCSTDECWKLYGRYCKYLNFIIFSVYCLDLCSNSYWNHSGRSGKFSASNGGIQA